MNGHIFGVFQRAVNGDKDVVKLLVSGSADPNKSDIYGKAPLISNITWKILHYIRLPIMVTRFGEIAC